MGIDWDRDEPASSPGVGGEAVVTEASVVGNEAAWLPLGLMDRADGAEATTEVSVVGKSGGGLVAGPDGVEVSGGCASDVSGSAAVLELFLFIAAS